MMKSFGLPIPIIGFSVESDTEPPTLMQIYAALKETLAIKRHAGTFPHLHG